MSDKKTIRLKKFSMQQIGDDKTVVMIGARGCGKSFITRELLYRHRDIPVAVCMSGTECSNEFYRGIIPRPFIHYEYKEEVVSNLLARQKRIMKRIKREERDQKALGRSNYKSQIDPRAVLLMDDVLYNQSWLNHQCIRECFCNGRHLKLLYLLTSQYALGITPILRSNVDFVFILRENKMNNRKRLYENYASVFPTFDVFCKAMDATTQGFDCMVIDNTARSTSIEDTVFWYCAPKNRPPFRLGSSELWNDEDSTDDDEEDPEAKRDAKTGLTISKRY